MFTVAAPAPDILSGLVDRPSVHVRRSPQISAESSAVAHAQLATMLGERLGAAATFATTEHFNLQTARSITVSEANGRANIYLAALSSNLIALAFVGETSRLGAAFYAFALILLPVLAFVGVVTFGRLVQSSIEDIAYAQRIGRLREFYLDLAPELDRYLVIVRKAPAEASAGSGHLAASGWQLTLTTAGMLEVVNSVVIGSWAGLILDTVGVRSLGLAIGTGAAIGAAALWVHRCHHKRALDAYRPEAIDRAAIVVPQAQQPPAC